MVKTWDEIKREYEEIANMPERPLMKKYPADYIIDENKPVSWNRKEVLRNNDQYTKEMYRLKKEKYEKLDRLMDEIYAAIQEEVGFGLDKEAAKLIWNKAYEDGHAFGINEIMIHLEELMDLMVAVLETLKLGG